MKLGESGFTVFELILVIALLGVLCTFIPGIDVRSLSKVSSQSEVQHLVDHLRWAQRRAILEGDRLYLTLEPDVDVYRLYRLTGDGEEVERIVQLKETDLIGINRSVVGMDQTFYFTANGTPVFGCTITLEDHWNEWRIVIGVASGKVRVERL